MMMKSSFSSSVRVAETALKEMGYEYQMVCKENERLCSLLGQSLLELSKTGVKNLRVDYSKYAIPDDLSCIHIAAALAKKWSQLSVEKRGQIVELLGIENMNKTEAQQPTEVKREQ